jgi:sugar phosphate isomerase/epimerase
MPCINAVSFLEDPSIESICRRVLAAGFDAIEVSRPPFYEKLRTRETRQRFAEWAREHSLGLRGFDCWVEVLPFQNMAETIDAFRAAVDFARELELEFIISHDAWLRDSHGASPNESLRKHHELFQPVVEMCHEADLQLLFEPHPDTLSMNTDWCIEFFDRFESASIGLIYDCCHYGVGHPENYLQPIERLGSRIRHIHFSDGDCDTYALHLPLGDGRLDLDAIVEHLKRIPFRGTLTNDLYSYPLLEDGARRNAAKIAQAERALGINSGKPANRSN